MNRIAGDQIEEIKSRVSIVDVIGQYVSLKKKGAHFVGLCPFHNEKTPSFTVNEEKGVFHCFGCGAGGDVFTFLMKIKGADFNEVLIYLAGISGVSLVNINKNKDVPGYYEINKMSSDYFRELLLSDSEGKKALEYLKTDRKLSMQTIDDYNIGYASKSWDGLLSFLKARNASLNPAFDIGLIIKKQKTDGYYDRFRGRIMFPINDVRGHIIAFSGRTFYNEEPKYLNSPDSTIYKKGMTLYGIDVARAEASKKGFIIFVEGFLDAIVMHQYGFKNTVATAGTAVSTFHINTVSKLVRDGVFIFDGDEAGEKASIRALDIIIDSPIEGRIVRLPEGYDPDTFLQKYGKDSMDKLVNNAGSLFEFYVKKRLEQSGKNTANRLKVLDEIVSIIQKIKTYPIKQELYIKKLEELSGISGTTIKKSFKKDAINNTRKGLPSGRNSDYIKDAELTLLAIVVEHPGIVRKLFNDGIVKMLTDPYVASSISHINTLYENGVRDIKTEFFHGQKEEKVNSVVSVAMLKELKESDIEELLEKSLKKIIKTFYVDEQKQLSIEIGKATLNGNSDILNELLKKKKELAVIQRQFL